MAKICIMPEGLILSEINVHGCPYFNESSLVQKVAEASRISRLTELNIAVEKEKA